MSHKYILDTHALVWYLEGDRKLGKRAKAIIEDPDSEMVLSIIALAEAAYVIQKGRIGIPTVEDLLADVTDDERIEIYPLTWEIFKRSLTPEGLTIPELHDRFIVSTGLHLQDLGYTVAVLTKDEAITNAEAIPVIW